MWTRKELKQRAKEALRRNYWKIVLVTALSMIVGGGFGYASSSSSVRSIYSVVAVNMEESGDVDGAEGNAKILPDDEITYEEADASVARMLVDADAAVDEMGVVRKAIFIILFMAIFLIIFLVIFVVMCAFVVFLCNPFYVGVQRFMLKSVDDKAEVRELAYGFDHSYKNIVKTMFQMNMQIFLWALLFVIPGIFKKYQYRMVPYLLAEHPDMDYKEALSMSKNMMYGEKWHAFVLDLSFVLWHMLGIITFGILELFYVAPYAELTKAALYRRLRFREAEVQ